MGDGIVLIHGAAHTAACWQPTVTELARSASDLPVLAVDLPGRGDTPEDLRQVTVKGCVEHVVERIEAARVDRVVVVAHSMGRRTNVPRRAASTCAASCGRPVDVLQPHDRVAAWVRAPPALMDPRRPKGMVDDRVVRAGERIFCQGGRRAGRAMRTMKACG